MIDESILNKIKNLIALSECKNGNVNEAAVAAARASALLTKHGLSRAEVMTAEESLREDPLVVQLAEEMEELPTWKAVLMANLTEAHDCVSFKAPRGLEVVGQSESVQAVVYLFRWLCGEIDRLCSDYAREGLHWTGILGARTASSMRSFRIGAALSISKRILASKQREMEWASEKALVHLSGIKRKLDEAKGQAKDFQIKDGDVADNYFAQMSGAMAADAIDIGQKKSLGPAGTYLKAEGEGNGF